MDIRENAAYIKGLADGYEIDKETKEGKIISSIYFTFTLSKRKLA